MGDVVPLSATKGTAREQLLAMVQHQAQVQGKSVAQYLRELQTQLERNGEGSRTCACRSELAAVRWPGLKLFKRSEMKVGPLHVPTALRASAQERSGLVPHFVAPLWRAPLVQSAGTRRKVTD